MNYSNPIIIFLRKVLRITNLNKFFVPLFYGRGYEVMVDKTLIDQISTNDIVWDIGANIGVYSKKFANKVGANGKVLAFEPHPETFKTLSNSISDKNITFHNLGFSKTKGNLKFSNGSNNALNRIVETNYDGETVNVNIETIDNFIENESCEVPNIMKIDVEGFELYLLEGMKKTIKKERLRTILIEVHHKLMDDMGIVNGGKSIKKFLEDEGYKINWLDPSHLIAKR